MIKNISIGQDWTKIADASMDFTATFGSGASQVEVAPNDTDEAPTVDGHTLYPELRTACEPSSSSRAGHQADRELTGPGYVYAKNTGGTGEVLCIVAAWPNTV